MLVAKAGRYAGVDLIPHVGRLSDPVFRGVCEAVAEAGVELARSDFAADARLHDKEVRG